MYFDATEGPGFLLGPSTVAAAANPNYMACRNRVRIDCRRMSTVHEMGINH